MHIALYAGRGKEVEIGRLQHIIESYVSYRSLEVFRSIGSFSERIHMIPRRIDVAVLFAQSRPELSDLMMLKDYLESIRIILILPDRTRETITMGHRLCPRFLTFADAELANVAAVLNKLGNSTFKGKGR